MYVTHGDLVDPLLVTFQREKKKKYKVVKTADGVELKRVKPLGTGGKPAYVMVMLTELCSLGLSKEAGHIVFDLIPFVDWNTGRLVKNGKALTQDKMRGCLDIGKVKLKTVLKELRAKNVIEYKSKAYYMKRNVIKKGGSYED